MKKEELIKLGLSEEQADAALVIHGKDIETHKAKLSTLETENGSLKTQVTEATSTIEGFKKLDVKSIQEAADEWKGKAEQAAEDARIAREEAEEQIAEIEFNQSLREALQESGAKNPVAVSALLDFDKLDVDKSGKITGLDDQLEIIKTENDYLFLSDDENPQLVLGGQNHSVIGDATIDAARKAAGLPPLKEE